MQEVQVDPEEGMDRDVLINHKETNKYIVLFYCKHAFSITRKEIVVIKIKAFCTFNISIFIWNVPFSRPPILIVWIFSHSTNVIVCLYQYENAIATAGQFLSVFLKKCASKSEETDFRPLFENFLQAGVANYVKFNWIFFFTKSVKMCI